MRGAHSVRRADLQHVVQLLERRQTSINGYAIVAEDNILLAPITRKLHVFTRHIEALSQRAHGLQLAGLPRRPHITLTSGRTIK